MSDKPWGGRFKERTSGAVENYTESISFDAELYAQDIAGSKAHAAMLGRQGVISSAEAEQLVSGLDQVRAEIEAGTFPWRQRIFPTVSAPPTRTGSGNCARPCVTGWTSPSSPYQRKPTTGTKHSHPGSPSSP